MWVGTITRKPKEFRYIFLLETRFFTTNGSASFSDIERIWNHQRHLYFDRHISSISSRATSRFKFERDWRYLFIQIKMTKERRCSLHWLTVVHVCIAPFRRITRRKFAIWHCIWIQTHKAEVDIRNYLRHQPFSLGSRLRTCLGTKILTISDFSRR